MALVTALMPTLIYLFGTSWLVILFMDFMDFSHADDVKPVEVVNLNDLSRR